MVTIERDLFANTADPNAYVPRTATEYALVTLEMALRDGARVTCLIGPAGSGKTLLLRVLEERLAGDFASLRVPYSKLDSDELCRWTLDALAEEPVADPERALAARIARGAAVGDPPLVWMIDDADLLPMPTLQTLLKLQPSTGDALRLVLASSRELRADEFAGVRPVNVELEGEMDRDEMAHYVRARLDHAAADPGQRAQIEAAIDELYARSHGNPGRLHAAAASLLCFGPDRLTEPVEESPGEESIETAPPAEIAAIAPAPAAQPAVAATSASSAGRISIESLVAEAVASEPLEEVAMPAPIAEHTTALVAPAVSAKDAPASAPPPHELPPPDEPPRPAPRKRHRLRRLVRR